MFSKVKMVLNVSGMHCDNCKKRVIQLLQGVDGVKKVKVDLNKGIVKIYSAHNIDILYLSGILKEAGYELTHAEVDGRK